MRREYAELYRCPLCGYETSSTNVCRQCPETPADHKAVRPVYCSTHEKCHFADDGSPTQHRSVNMYATGFEQRILGRRTKRRLRKGTESYVKFAPHLAYGLKVGQKRAQAALYGLDEHGEPKLPKGDD